MKNTEISEHELRLFQSLSKTKWQTTLEIAELSRIARRTASMHLKKYAKMGIVETASVFPGHRFRLSVDVGIRNPGYMARLRQAGEIFYGTLK